MKIITTDTIVALATAHGSAADSAPPPGDTGRTFIVRL